MALLALANRAVLRREADPGGMASYAKALGAGRDLEWISSTFLLRKK